MHRVEATRRPLSLGNPDTLIGALRSTHEEHAYEMSRMRS